jgi:hypothetical protein
MGVHFDPKKRLETSSTHSLKLGRLRAGVFFCTQEDRAAHSALLEKIMSLEGIEQAPQTPDDISIRLTQSVANDLLKLQEIMSGLNNLIPKGASETEATEAKVLRLIIATIEKLTNTQFTLVLNAPEEEEEAASSFRP